MNRRQSDCLEFQNRKRQETLFRKRQPNVLLRILDIPYMVAALNSNDNYNAQFGAIQFSNLLSIEPNPPIWEVIQAGVVPRYVEFLGLDHLPDLQSKAAWILPFITTARESLACRDLILESDEWIQLLCQLSEHSKLAIIRIATWTLLKLFEGVPPPSLNQLNPAIPVLARLVVQEWLRNVCWAFVHLSFGSHENIQAVIDSGVFGRVVELLADPIWSLLTPVILIVTDIADGTDDQAQFIVNAGVLLPLLSVLVDDHNYDVKGPVCDTIASISGRNVAQKQAVIEAGFIALRDQEDPDVEENEQGQPNGAVNGNVAQNGEQHEPVEEDEEENSDDDDDDDDDDNNNNNNNDDDDDDDDDEEEEEEEEEEAGGGNQDGMCPVKIFEVHEDEEGATVGHVNVHACNDWEDLADRVHELWAELENAGQVLPDYGMHDCWPNALTTFYLANNAESDPNVDVFEDVRLAIVEIRVLLFWILQ